MCLALSPAQNRQSRFIIRIFRAYTIYLAWDRSWRPRKWWKPSFTALISREVPSFAYIVALAISSSLPGLVTTLHTSTSEPCKYLMRGDCTLAPLDKTTSASLTSSPACQFQKLSFLPRGPILFFWLLSCLLLEIFFHGQWRPCLSVT